MSEQIKEFRAWCQKVLPLVYDDSLSYYELLCKVTNKLNEVINGQNDVSQEMKDLQAQFELLKSQLTGVIQEEAERVIEQFASEHNLISTVNGIGADAGTGNVTLKAGDVGAIANVSGSVKTNNLQDGSVTGGKIGALAVTEGKIASGAVTNGKIATDAVTEAKIKDGAVTSGKLAANSVSQGNIQSGAVSTGKIGGKAVTTEKIADQAITRDKIANGEVTGEKVSADSISDLQLSRACVTTEKIRDGNVTAVKLARGAVGTNSLNDGAVTNAKIGNYQIDGNKIADNAINTSRKLADGVVEPVKINGGGADNKGKILKVGANGVPYWGVGAGSVAGVESVNGKSGVVTLTSADIGAIRNTNKSVKLNNINYLIDTDAGFVRDFKTIFPDATKENPKKLYYYGYPIVSFDGESIKFDTEYTGVLWYKSHLNGLNIDLSDIYGNAANKVFITKANGATTFDVLDTVHIRDEAITIGKIARGAVSESKLGGGAVTESKIGSGAVTESKIGSGAVTESKIVSGAVTESKIGSGAVTENKIGSGAVTESKIGSGAVTTDKLEDMAVTLAKIDNQGVENSGKVLMVQSNGDVGLGTVETEKDKTVTIHNSKGQFIKIIKTAYSTKLVYSCYPPVTVTTEGTVIGSVDKNMFGPAFQKPTSTVTKKYSPDKTVNIASTLLPAVAAGAPVQFGITLNGDKFDIGVYASSSTASSTTATILELPGF